MKKRFFTLVAATVAFVAVVPVTTFAAETMVETEIATETEENMYIANAGEEKNSSPKSGVADMILPIGSSTYFDLAEGQSLKDALATINENRGGDGVVGLGTEIVGNEYTYVGVLENGKKQPIFITIPYWYADAFPDTKWYLLKNNKLQAKVTVKPQKGQGRKFTKTVTLPRNSRSWSRISSDDNNKMTIPPVWIQKLFKEEGISIYPGNDPDFGPCQVIVLRTWKNKSAKKAKKNPIIKVIHYVNYNHYRVATTNRYEDDGLSPVIID